MTHPQDHDRRAEAGKRLWIVEQTIRSKTMFLIEADSWDEARQKCINDEVSEHDAVGNETEYVGPYRLIREDKQ